MSDDPEYYRFELRLSPESREKVERAARYLESRDGRPATGADAVRAAIDHFDELVSEQQKAKRRKK